MEKRARFVVLLCIVVAATLVVYFFRTPIVEWYRGQKKDDVPVAVDYSEIATTSSETEETTDDTLHANALPSDTADNATEMEAATEETVTEKTTRVVPPAELNLAIPFTPQAPHANWNLPYQEACEEAAVLMAARFLQGRSIDGPDDADKAILELVDYNSTALGQPIDTTAEQTAHIIESFYELEAEVIYDWNWDDVKQALAQGYPVLVPAAGQELGNPYFRHPGPLYHMLVIKGYTDKAVITNDPGTRRGADYQYTYETVYNANHDWNDGDVANGEKVMIIVKP